MAGSVKPKAIWKLADKWVLPFLASWRTMEKTLNPAFTFILRCGSCGETSGQTKESDDFNAGPVFVHSKKRQSCIIGIMCQNCGQTVKFGKKGIALFEDDVPVRFHKYPKSALESPDGSAPTDSASKVMLKEAKRFLEIE